MTPIDNPEPLDEGTKVYVPAPPEGLTDAERILWLASLGALQGPYSVETAPDGRMSRITAPDAVNAAEREIVADLLYRGCAHYFSLLEPAEVRGMLSEVSRMRAALASALSVMEAVPGSLNEYIGDLPGTIALAHAALARPAKGEPK